MTSGPSVLEQVRALGAQAIAVRADVSIEDEVIALFHRVIPSSAGSPHW